MIRDIALNISTASISTIQSVKNFMCAGDQVYPRPPVPAGLYHAVILYPTRASLADAVRRLSRPITYWDQVATRIRYEHWRRGIFGWLFLLAFWLFNAVSLPLVVARWFSTEGALSTRSSAAISAPWSFPCISGQLVISSLASSLISHAAAA
jgi:hypothetical protein